MTLYRHRSLCLVTLFLFFPIFLGGCTIVNVPLFPSERALQERVVEGEGDSKILLIDISGLISEKERNTSGWLREGISIVSEVKEALKKAESDDAICGLILRINSPGGTVTASDIIHHELKLFKEKTGVRITACLMDVGASGGYYVATAADEIIAHPTTITGSIGVITLKFNVEGLLSRIGIKEETVKSADKKDILSPFRPSTPEEQKIIQAIIDSLHQRFISVVTDGRKPLTRKDVEKLADGRIYTASQAQRAKLIDRVGYLNDAIQKIKQFSGIENASVITYSRPGTYKGSIYSALPKAPTNIINLISINGQGLITPPGVHFMYLWVP
jgi:protease-4